jgi:molybdate transport repressor ModE-like protein
MDRDLWPGVEFRHLQTLRAIAQWGSFHAAAHAMEYAQPAVSQHLAALESVVGLRLVDRRRGGRRATLTAAGSLLLQHADAVATRLRAAQADMRALVEGSAGTLRVGTYQSVSARIVPALLRRFSELWPKVGVELREGPDDGDLLGRLAAGELDLIFCGPPPADGPFSSAEVLRDPWFLLVSHGSPLAQRRRPLAVSDLADVPLVAFRATSSAQSALEDFIRGHGVALSIVFRTDDNATVQGLVANGYGSAIVPALAIDLADPRVERIPIDIPPRRIVIAWHRDRVTSPGAEFFIATAQGVGRDLGHTLPASTGSRAKRAGGIRPAERR